MKFVERTSIFDNSEFTDGYIEFTESEQYKKYMVPFLGELINETRCTLEKTDEPFIVQERLKTLRLIESKARQIVMNKDVAVNGDR